MGYYSALKQKGIRTPVTWMDLENSVLGAKASLKRTNSIYPRSREKSKSKRQKVGCSHHLPGAEGRVERECFMGTESQLCKMKTVLEMDSVNVPSATTQNG